MSQVPYPPLDGTEPCRQWNPDFYYPTKDTASLTIQAVITRTCGSCHVQQECLTWGLHHENYGYWGGVGPKERKRMRRALRISLVTPSSPIWEQLEEAS